MSGGCIYKYLHVCMYVCVYVGVWVVYVYVYIWMFMFMYEYKIRVMSNMFISYYERRNTGVWCKDADMLLTHFFSINKWYKKKKKKMLLLSMAIK